MRKNRLFLFAFLLFLLSGVSNSYAFTAIDTQPSSDGTLEVSLIGLKVRNGVLTAKFSLKNVSDKNVEPRIVFAQAYYIDTKGEKKYFVLKDEKGMYIAGPQHFAWEGGTFKAGIAPGNQAFIWMKFPAPPEGTEEIDIYLPGVLPFEAIELQGN